MWLLNRPRCLVNKCVAKDGGDVASDCVFSGCECALSACHKKEAGVAKNAPLVVYDNRRKKDSTVLLFANR